MTSVLSTLEALLIKATYKTLPKVDESAVKDFCLTMRDTTEAPQLAAQVIAARMHSLHPREAMLALELLDRCMRVGSHTFQAEIGKFRFLNEMIKLVSPKYFANRTAPEVRDKVLQLLRHWAYSYSKESKFYIAYEMLKNQGVVIEPTLPPLPGDKSKGSIFEDEEKSKLIGKLLHSNKEEDLQHANRLIKSMVKEDERITQAKSRREQEINLALDAAGLLKDMLRRAPEASLDERQLMKELASSCWRQYSVLRHMPVANITSNDYELEMINTCNILEEVTIDYNIFISDEEEKIKAAQESNDKEEEEVPLLDFGGANRSGEEAAKNTIEELSDIFKVETAPGVMEVLQPVTVVHNEEKEVATDKPKAEGWNELDSLGQELLKMSLPGNSKKNDGFSSKTMKKISMNELEKPTSDNPNNNNSILDFDFFTKTMEAPKDPTDDVMVDISIKEKPSIKLSKDCELKVEKEIKMAEVKPLSDIHITLDEVAPGNMGPMVVFKEDGGLCMLLHFCKNRPREDVYVIVMSTTSRIASPIDDYKFQAAVSKGCKVRLLEASGSTLPAFNPFVPSPAITQILLVGAPKSVKTFTLKFIVTYNCNNETYSEMGEANDLCLDNV